MDSPPPPPLSPVVILGGGPAGCFAALAARSQGAPAELIERSPHFPRHKVCGEFLSPEIVPVLERAGVLPEFLALEPARVSRMLLNFGKTAKRADLSEPAYGLSRYEYDRLLWNAAHTAGARLAPDPAAPPTVIATGRPAGMPSRQGDRLFGFKAHFTGPVDDAVELYFVQNAYVGINTVEKNRTNVCGLATESALKAVSFEPESLFNDPLRQRLRPLTQEWKWLFTGPLEFRQNWDRRDAYLAGDALSFVDPFTGSGLLCGAVTGWLAGLHAAQRVPVAEHARICRAAIGRPFQFSSALRTLASTVWAERLLPFVPGNLLYRLTRPHAR